ncbi:MAG: ATP synthase F1 subunit gamma [Oscillospiraceae bacterium]|jgi:F-type H+-transporting ATPase subunit gamma|nr:ATP synthase F1 subunit gamma [Oscillospiraceae bacterium]
MSAIGEIRRHITAVEQTKKITGAMEMVSSNRMRQVMGHIDQNRLYFANIRRAMKELLTSSQDVTHPYFTERPRNHCTYIVISGDKGLCGSHNSAVLNYTLNRIKETPDASLVTMGHTAEDFFHIRGITPDIAFLGIVQDPTLTKARVIARELTHLFEAELTDDIRIIYTSFYGASKGTPVEFRLLPIKLHDYDDVSDAEALWEIMYHPSAQQVLDILVPQYIIGLVFGVMVQAYASEHFARMNAMRAATSNAQDMLDDLRIRHNLVRQGAITDEIAEITGAAEALRGSVTE